MKRILIFCNTRSRWHLKKRSCSRFKTCNRHCVFLFVCSFKLCKIKLQNSATGYRPKIDMHLKGTGHSEKLGLSHVSESDSPEKPLDCKFTKKTCSKTGRFIEL